MQTQNPGLSVVLPPGIGTTTTAASLMPVNGELQTLSGHSQSQSTSRPKVWHHQSINRMSYKGVRESVLLSLNFLELTSFQPYICLTCFSDCKSLYRILQLGVLPFWRVWNLQNYGSNFPRPFCRKCQFYQVSIAAMSALPRLIVIQILI